MLHLQRKLLLLLFTLTLTPTLLTFSAPAPLPKLRTEESRLIGVWLVYDYSRIEVWTFTKEKVGSEGWKRWYYFAGYPITWHYHEEDHREAHKGKWKIQGRCLLIHYDDIRMTHEIGTRTQKKEVLPDGPYFPNISLTFIRKIPNYEIERAK